MSAGIVVGLDDSASARAALAWAASQARLTNAPVRAVAVLDWAKEVGGYGYTWNAWRMWAPTWERTLGRRPAD